MQPVNHTLEPPLQFGTRFDVRIVATNVTLEMKLGGNNAYSYNYLERNLPLWAVQYIVVGSLLLFNLKKKFFFFLRKNVICLTQVKGGIETENHGTILQMTKDIQVKYTKAATGIMFMDIE